MNKDELNYWSLYWYRNIYLISKKLNWLICYENLSSNKNITSILVENNIEKYWNFYNLLECNPNSMDNLLDNLLNTRQIPWGFSNTISGSVSLKFEYIKEYSYLDDDWDWYAISRNPNITMEIIELNLEYPWDWESVSDNPNLTIDFVKKYPEFDWDWENITLNSSMTVQIIENNIDNPWLWEKMHYNININSEFIEKYKDKGWDYCEIFRTDRFRDRSMISKKMFDNQLKHINSNLVNNISTIMQKHIYELNECFCLSENVNTTWETIEKYPNLGWSWDKLSYNDNITIDIIEKNLDKNWNWKQLSSNPNLTRDFIIKYNDKNWCWVTLFKKNKIDFDFIKDRICPSEYKILSKSDKITIQIIRDNIKKPWDWYNLSCNSKIFMDDIQNTMKWEWFILNTNNKLKLKSLDSKYIEYRKNLKFKWDIDGVLYNTNLTFKFLNDNCKIILQHKNNNWDNNNWEHIILQHSMEYEMKLWHNLRIIKTLQIQKHWRNCSSNTSYKLARRLLKNNV